MVGAAKAKDIGGESVISAVAYDYAPRRQQAFAEITVADQKAILRPQAIAIGTETEFSNKDRRSGR